jgi:hypothetical protein
VAGINGTNEKKTLDVDLSFIDGADHCVQTFADADPSQYQLASDKDWFISCGNQIPRAMTCQPRGGFVLVIK